MVKNISLITLICFTLNISAQTAYIDMLTAPAMLEYSATLKKQLEKTNKNLSNIQKGQLLVAAQLKYANDLHDKVLKELTTVSETVQNAIVIKEIYEISNDIIEDTKEALKFAAGNPEYTLFVTESLKEFKYRSLNIITEITKVTTGGENNMMDSGERLKLLYSINTKMRLIGANVYMIKQNMYWAKMKGFWSSINPLEGWINNDAMLMKGIINDAKNL